MKARIPSHREFIINFPDSVDQAKANEGWAKLQQVVEDYKKAHNGASVYAPTFIEDCEPEVKKLQEEYGFEYTVEYVQEFLTCLKRLCTRTVQGRFYCQAVSACPIRSINACVYRGR